ncbi:type VII secretion protein EccB [Solwaraspora sp. WMMD406]|uniref:type VII secretion protein EccB n=1 Tax=Solwaraspora sp. WMMD406 TaxID=3016095 RepID=UPI002416F4FF|nr:type VII secretion protein EccB [Solwaraspora sp. WMMD406]MDG4765986.1 type VII secretion protein EccB [Solwaraspora sp. WMMD406]
MQSRRDQVQAHMFTMSRLSAAMLRSAPDHPDQPTGRSLRGILGGLALAFIVAVLVTIVSVLFPPAREVNWRVNGAVVVDVSSGARYLYADGVLHPVANLTSLRLILGGEPSVVTVERAALVGTPRGAPVGVVGAPERLPDPGGLSRAPWLACAAVAGRGADAVPRFVLEVATDRPVQPLGAEGTLVSAPDGSVHLLVGETRHLFDADGGAREALGYGTAPVRPVPAEFLRLLPAGPDLSPPEVSRRGDNGPILAGTATRLGQVFSGPGGAAYLLTGDGLVSITPTVLALLIGDPRTQDLAYGGATPQLVPIGARDVAEHRSTRPPEIRVDALPSVPPPLTDPAGDDLCASVSADQDQPVLTLVTAAPVGAPLAGAPASGPTLAAGLVPGCGQVDQVVVAGDTGVLLRTTPTATWYLVADTGARYPLGEDGPAPELGYRGQPAARLPEALVELLPTGPVLDPEAYRPGGSGAAAPRPECD